MERRRAYPHTRGFYSDDDLSYLPLAPSFRGEVDKNNVSRNPWMLAPQLTGLPKQQYSLWSLGPCDYCGLLFCDDFWLMKTGAPCPASALSLCPVEYPPVTVKLATDSLAAGFQDPSTTHALGQHALLGDQSEHLTISHADEDHTLCSSKETLDY